MTDNSDITSLDRDDKEKLLELLQEEAKRKRENRFFSIFPDEGEYSRDKYKKHIEFIKAGAKYKERLFMAGNRTGKTYTGGFEMTAHLTGLYPDWWEGKRFSRPITAWVAGPTNLGVRDVIQVQTLLGARVDMGTELIPKHLIEKTINKSNVPDAIETVYVKHVSGGYSRLVFKTYEAETSTFSGMNVDVIWLDEQPPKPIYDECLVRLTTTKGILFVTFTPDKGFNDTIAGFFPEGKIRAGEITDYRHVSMVSLDDASHIANEEKERIKKSLDPNLVEAKYYGIPYLGSGRIYRVPESEIVVEPFPIPEYWPRVFALDPGWTRTAAVWFAIDPNTGTIYLYDEYARTQAEIAIHVNAIINKSKGLWMPGVVDPYYIGKTNAADGKKFSETFRNFGLDLIIAKGGLVETGIQELYQAFSSGKLKVFRTCSEWLQEYRVYRRDDKGKIVEQFDDLMDATRYGYLSGLDFAMVKPDEESSNSLIIDPTFKFKGRNDTCGY